MVNSNLKTLLLGLQLCYLGSILSIADDSLNNQVLENVNKFRQEMKLPILTENTNAACLAQQMAEQFKGQPCTNATGEDTVPGTEPQLPNYPQLLDHCHLNISDTRDGVVLPDCVPNSNPDIASQNITGLQYLQYVNDTKYVSAGVGSADSWFVLVLATNTTGGNFQAFNKATLDGRNILLPLLLILGTLLVVVQGHSVA
eukprot:Gb_16655 [translate_table: standard]